MPPEGEGQDDPVPVDDETVTAWSTYRPRTLAPDPRFHPAEQDCE